jgi:5-epi-alpha-selinene synthase
MEKPSAPTFYCPFPPQLNPSVEAVHQHTLQWAVDVGLVTPGDKRHQRLQKARFAWLTALTQPYSELEDLKLAADWHTWLFAHDDVLDATAVGRDPQRVEAIHAGLIKILHGHEPESEAEGLALALADICQRIARRTGPIWPAHFVYSVEQYLQANVWESANRYENVTPDLTTYVKLRQFSGAVFTCFNIIYLTLDLPPQTRFLQHVYVQQLAMMANHHICWVNDIMGLQKEIHENNMSNLVLVLQKQHNLTLPEAISAAIDCCDQEMQAFIQLEERLPTFAADEQAQLAAYLHALHSWMSGHIQWYKETGRYVAPDLA